MQSIFIFVFAMAFTLIFKMGFWGFILGLFLAPFVFKLYIQLRYGEKVNTNPQLFLMVSFEIFGHLSKAKGVVTVNDIRVVTELMDSLKLEGDVRKSAQDAFNRGKSASYPLNARVKELYESYRYQRNVLNIFCEQMVKVALSDGSLQESERVILFMVSDELHIRRDRMALYIQMMMASYGFQSGDRSSRGQESYGEQGYYQQGYQQNRDGYSIKNAYQILGVNETDDVTKIKRAYRKLMNEHHPDKLVSKGLPKEMMETAKKRAQEIQAAYDLIKSHRNFK